jgi:uncharacterized repeat protein (TIGR01451 family)
VRNRRSSTRIAGAVVALAIPFVLTGTSPAAAATTQGGSFADAKGVIVDLVALTALPVPGPLAGSPLDPNTFANASQSCPRSVGTPSADKLLNIPAAPAVTADVVSTLAGATCAKGREAALASAITTNPKLIYNAGVPMITADIIQANANSSCTAAPNAAGSIFQNLKVNGMTVLPNPEPNTRIDIPGLATVIINEQHPSATGRGIVVNGLHVIADSPLLRGDLIVSHAVSGVVCPGGPGSTNNGPTISFSKNATPSTAKPGERVTYTATVRNTTGAACDVLRLVDHVSPAFDLVSSSGEFGTALVTPAPRRADGGVDAVLRPTGLTIAPGASRTQRFVVVVKAGTAPGTYYNNLEIFCGFNGDFTSGPLAPVTVPAPPSGPVITPPGPVVAPPPALPRTGGAPLAAAGALVLLATAFGVQRLRRTGQ